MLLCFFSGACIGIAVTLVVVAMVMLTTTLPKESSD